MSCGNGPFERSGPSPVLAGVRLRSVPIVCIGCWHSVGCSRVPALLGSVLVASHPVFIARRLARCFDVSRELLPIMSRYTGCRATRDSASCLGKSRPTETGGGLQESSAAQAALYVMNPASEK